MLTHPTLDKLQALKLTGMYQALLEQTQMPEITELGFEERLGASIIGSATLCFSRWTQRRGRQLHCVQNRRKH